MKEVKFFILKNGSIHTFYPKSNTSTVGVETFKIECNKIVFEELGSFSLFEDLTTLIEIENARFKETYAFVDEEGVIHYISKDGKSSSFFVSETMNAIFEDVIDDGFPYYKGLRFVDKNGIIPDQGNFVCWTHNDLATELDETFGMLE